MVFQSLAETFAESRESRSRLLTSENLAAANGPRLFLGDLGDPADLRHANTDVVVVADRLRTGGGIGESAVVVVEA